MCIYIYTHAYTYVFIQMDIQAGHSQRTNGMIHIYNVRVYIYIYV